MTPIEKTLLWFGIGLFLYITSIAINKKWPNLMQYEDYNDIQLTIMQLLVITVCGPLSIFIIIYFIKIYIKDRRN